MFRVIVCFLCCNLVESAKRTRRKACHTSSLFSVLFQCNYAKRMMMQEYFHIVVLFLCMLQCNANHNEEDDDFDVLEWIIIICCFVVV